MLRIVTYFSTRLRDRSGPGEGCDLGYEDPLLRPEPDDHPAPPGLDDLPYAELGVPDPPPRPIRGRSQGGSLGLAPPREGRAPPAPAARGSGNRARFEGLGYLREEARGHLVLSLAPVRAELGVGEGERLPGAREANVAEPALLLQVLLVEGARVREGPLLHPHDEDVIELEPLGVVQRHQRDPSALGTERVLVGVERLLLQKALQGGLRIKPFVLPRGVYELLQVLQTRLSLYGVLGLELRAVAGLGEDGPHQLYRGNLSRRDPPALEEIPHRPARLPRRPREVHDVGLGERLVERDAVATGVLLQPRHRGRAKAPLGDVDDAL